MRNLSLHDAAQQLVDIPAEKKMLADVKSHIEREGVEHWRRCGEPQRLAQLGQYNRYEPTNKSNESFMASSYLVAVPIEVLDNTQLELVVCPIMVPSNWMHVRLNGRPYSDAWDQVAKKELAEYIFQETHDWRHVVFTEPVIVLQRESTPDFKQVFFDVLWQLQSHTAGV